MSYNHRLEQLNDCYETTLKLGGIPSFNLYYKSEINILNVKSKSDNKYNPMRPCEDSRNKYIWKTHNTLGTNYLLKSESLTIPIFHNSNILYCRQEHKFNNDEHNSIFLEEEEDE